MEKLRNKLLLIPYIFIVAIITASLVKAQATVIAISPAELVIPEEDIGKTFELNVTVEEVTNLWFWEVKVTWDKNVLTCLEIKEGPFLKDVGSTMFPLPLIDNVNGEIPLLCCGLMMPGGATGTGTLATITFNATAPGVTDVVLNNTDLVDWADKAELPIPHTRETGTITVIPEFPASIILPLFLITTATIAIIAKAAWSRRRRGYINAP